MLYFRTHSYRADNCQAKENLQNEDEADIKAAQWIFKVRKKCKVIQMSCSRGLNGVFGKEEKENINVMNNSHRLFITKTSLFM